VPLRQQLADPWGLVAAGLAVVALAVAVVYGLRARAARPVRGPAELPAPAVGSPAEAWLRRAEQAVRTLREQAPPEVGTVVARTLDELHGAAARLAAVEDAAARIDVSRLQEERTQLVRAVFDAPDGSERRRHTRAAQVVADQLASYGRLREAGDTLAARLETTVAALEGLAATPEGPVARGPDPVPGLTGELDRLRAGLAEADAVSRQVPGRSSRA
jgi:hypothetical protein